MVGWIPAIVGTILVLVAIRYISDAVGDFLILRDMVLATVTAVIGLVVGVFVILECVLGYRGLPSLNSLASVRSLAPPSTGNVGLIVGVIAGLIVVYVLLIVSAIFARWSYNSIATHLGVGMFRTAGFVYLIGAATTIIPVGFIILFVAIILNIVAFLSVTDVLPQSGSGQVVSAQPPPQM